MRTLPPGALRFARSGLLLALALAVGLAVRLPMLPEKGYRWDMYSHAQWMQRVASTGLLAAYDDARTFGDHTIDLPPVSVLVLMAPLLPYAAAHPDIFEVPAEQLVDESRELVTRLKLPGVVFDLLLIAAGFWIAQRRAGPLWAAGIALALALSPVLLIDSAWWGQFDSVFTFFVVMTVDALERRRTGQAWVWFALGILTKMQAVVVLPLLLVLTIRRAGWPALGRGLALAAVTFMLFVLPFLPLNGPRAALRHYIEATNKYPFVTVKGHNFWFWALASSRDMDAAWHLMPPDTEATWGQGIYWGPISARLVGLGIVGALALLIMLRAWVYPERDDAFLLAAGLYAAFFTFATQMQVRYLYPAAVLILFALIGRLYLLPLALALTATVTYNILSMASRDFPLWRTLDAWLFWETYQNAGLNLLLTLIILALILAPLRRWSARRQPG
jgi:hypothetical protein